jgi:hypothetical protein
VGGGCGIRPAAAAAAAAASERHPVGRTTAKLEAGTECGSHHRRSSNHSNHSGLRRCGCYGGCLNSGSDHYKLHHHHQDPHLPPHRHTPRGSGAVAAHVDASRQRPRSTRPVAAAVGQFLGGVCVASIFRRRARPLRLRPVACPGGGGGGCPGGGGATCSGRCR